MTGSGLAGSRAARRLLLAALLSLSACASTPSGQSIRADLVLWPKGADQSCDFETPRRDIAYAISYGMTPKATGRPTLLTPALPRYVIRNTQMRIRPQVGDNFCLALRRGPLFGSADAVLGFDVYARTPEALEISPVSARMERSALNGRSGGTVGVTVGFASGLYGPEDPEMVSAVRFRLGPVVVDGVPRPVADPAQVLLWPGNEHPFDILRLGVVVVESRDNGDFPISDPELQATLSPQRP